MGSAAVHRAPLVLPIVSPPVEDGAVVVADGRIVAVGPAERVAGAGPVTHHGGVLLPGLINAHAHFQYGPSFADLADGRRPFASWIREVTGRRRAFDPAAWRAEAAASWEAARASGTTAVADVVTDLSALDADVPGVRHVESVALSDEQWPAEQERLRRLLAERPGIGLAPHSLYTLGRRVLRGIVGLAREHGRRIHLHLAESIDEGELVRGGGGSFAGLPFVGPDGRAQGCSPTAHLNTLGGLGRDVHVAHGTHLDAADRSLLRARGTAVALCVRSNRLLQAGEPPVAALLAEGNPVAVGTDSMASTPSLDLLEELRELAALARRQGYLDDDLARRLVTAATVGGADALGSAERGRLVPGARADLAVFAVDRLDAADPYEELLRSGRCVTVRMGE